MQQGAFGTVAAASSVRYSQAFRALQLMAVATAAAPASLCSDEARVFLDILTHDDHNSHYVLARRAAGGAWSETAIKAGDYAALSFADNADYYLTRNGFTGRRRLLNRVRQINALMFDIDCHGGNSALVLPDLTACVLQAINDGSLPEPSLLVDTGRGLHLYFVLHRATPYRVKGGSVNERGLKFVKDVEASLAASIERVVSGIPGAQLDRSVFDFARVGRVPGSFNAAAGRRCTLLAHSQALYTLEDLKAYAAPAAASAANAAPAAPRRGRLMKFDRLMGARLRKVEELQAFRGFDCYGSRQNMCFVYYNTATQIYGPEEALSLTLRYNARFKSPLPEADIRAISRTVDKVVIQFGACKGQKGFYPLKAGNLAEKLGMSAEEAKQTNFFASKRMEDRMAAREATVTKRKNRNAEIVRLYAKEGLTQAEVVSALAGSEFACCLRTVASVIKRAGAKRAVKVALKEAAGLALAATQGAKAAAQDSPVSFLGFPHAKNWQTGCCVDGPLPCLDSSAGPPPLSGFSCGLSPFASST